jgi:hypothetical protein
VLEKRETERGRERPEDREEGERALGVLIPSLGRRRSSGTLTARWWHPAVMEQTRSCFSSRRKTMKR